MAHDTAARYSMSPADKENFVGLLERLAAADSGYNADQDIFSDGDAAAMDSVPPAIEDIASNYDTRSDEDGDLEGDRIDPIGQIMKRVQVHYQSQCNIYDQCTSRKGRRVFQSCSCPYDSSCGKFQGSFYCMPNRRK